MRMGAGRVGGGALFGVQAGKSVVYDLFLGCEVDHCGRGLIAIPSLICEGHPAFEVGLSMLS